MKKFSQVDFVVMSNDLNGQVAEIHKSRILTREQKQMCFCELGLKKDDLRIMFGGRYDLNGKVYVYHKREKKASYTFGVEIECFMPREVFVENARNHGISAQYMGYTHAHTTYYKLVTDASLSGERNPIECVSPVLKGTNGFKSLKGACDAMRETGAKVNHTCGLHVHIGAENISSEHYANIFKNYQMMEVAIDSFMARSRRENNGFYCLSLRSESLGETRESIQANLHSRYYKVNPRSYERHKTIEFRQHQGTTNYTKISNWVKFLVKLVDWSKDNRLSRPIDAIDDIPFITAAEKRYFKARKSEVDAINE